MAMSVGMMILGIGMPIITIILLIMTMLIKNIFKQNKLMWGLIISLGLFNIAMILEHTGMMSGTFLAWAHIVLPIGALMIYLGLKK